MSKEDILRSIRNAKYASLQSFFDTRFHSDEYEGSINDMDQMKSFIETIRHDAENLSRDEYMLLENNQTVQTAKGNIGVILSRYSSHSTLSGARLVESIASNILSKKGSLEVSDTTFLNNLSKAYIISFFNNSTRSMDEYNSYQPGEDEISIRDFNGHFYKAIIDAIGPKKTPSLFRDAADNQNGVLDDTHLYMKGDDGQPLYLFATTFQRNEKGSLGTITYHPITPKFLIDHIMKGGDNGLEFIGFNMSISQSPEHGDKNSWGVLTIHRSRDALPQFAAVLLNDFMSPDFDLSQHLSPDLYKKLMVDAELFINNQLKDYQIDPKLVGSLKPDIYISPFTHLDQFRKSYDQDAFFEGAMNSLKKSAYLELHGNNVSDDLIKSIPILKDFDQSEELGRFRGGRKLSQQYNAYTDLNYTSSDKFVGVDVFVKGVVDAYRQAKQSPADRAEFITDLNKVISDEMSSIENVKAFYDQQIDLVEKVIDVYKAASSDSDFGWNHMDGLSNAIYNYPLINPLFYTSMMSLMEEAAIEKDNDIMDLCLDAITQINGDYIHEINDRIHSLQRSFNDYYDEHSKALHDESMASLAQQGKPTSEYKSRNNYMTYPSLGIPRYHDFNMEQSGLDSLITYKHFCELQLIRHQTLPYGPTPDFGIEALKIGSDDVDNRSQYNPAANKDNEHNSITCTGKFRTQGYYISDDDKEMASNLFYRVGNAFDNMSDSQFERFKSLFTHGNSFDHALFKNTGLMADGLVHVDRKKIVSNFDLRSEILLDALNSSNRLISLIEDKEMFGFRQGQTILNNFEKLGKKLSTDTIIRLNNLFICSNNEDMSVGLISAQMVSMIKENEKINPRLMKHIFNGFGSMDRDTLLDRIDDFCIKSGHYKLTDIILESEAMMELMESNQGNIISMYHQNRFAHEDNVYKTTHDIKDEPDFDNML
jgi:hypothetical protein